MRPVSALVALLFLFSCASTAHAAPSAKQLNRQVSTLKAKVKRQQRAYVRLEARADRLDARLTERTSDRDVLQLSVNDLRPKADRVPALEAENARLASENEGLRGALPDQVAAVAKRGNISELFSLVISPAHSNWACGGSRFFGETFWSIDFDRRASDGSCY